MNIGSFNVIRPIPRLKRPHALVMLQPWVDVGSVGTLILAWLEAHFQAKELASLETPGEFFDFTRYRPTSYYQGFQRQLSVPNSFVTYGKQKTGNDFLFLHLLEPHSHSEAYVDSVISLLEKFNVKRYCLLGSMYDLVPHTRPLSITGGAAEEKTRSELQKYGVNSSNYQGPTTILSLVPQRLQEAGVDTMSLIVHLPQYTQLDDNYIGASRLMEVLSSMYNVPVDNTYFEKTRQQMAQINEALEKNPQLKSVVNQLESHYEAKSRKKEEEQSPRLSPEVEKFLSEMDKRFRES